MEIINDETKRLQENDVTNIYIHCSNAQVNVFSNPELSELEVASQFCKVEVIAEDGEIVISEQNLTEGAENVLEIELPINKKIKSLFCTTENGNVSIKDCNIEKIKVKTENGAIAIESKFKMLEINTRKGKTVVASKNSEDSEIELRSESGNINLTMQDVKFYDVSIKNNYGDTYIEHSTKTVVKKNLKKDIKIKPNNANKVYEVKGKIRTNSGTILIH